MMNVYNMLFYRNPVGIRLSGMFAAVVLTGVLQLRAPAYGGPAGEADRATLRITGLKCENRVTPWGVDVESPRLSWVLSAIDSAGRGQRQSAWHVQVASNRELLEAGSPDVWDSGKTEGKYPHNIAYAGKKQESGSTYFWRVKVWDERNIPSSWSRPSYWQTGLLSASDWKGKWISDNRPLPLADTACYEDQPAPLFRKVFAVGKKVKSAVLYVTGVGYYEAYINGKRVGVNRLDPGQTDYSKSVLYSTYEVTSLLKPAGNCIGIMLGNGWYNPLPLRMWGRFDLRKALAVGKPALLAQLDIRFEDGSTKQVFSDATWEVAGGPVIRNSVYLGEHYDNRKFVPGWSTPAFKVKGWEKARLCAGPAGRLQAQPQPPVIIGDTLVPVQIRPLADGKYLVDFGRNFGGVIRMQVNAKRGTTIRIRYGELLYPDGSLNVMTSTAGQVKKRGTGGPGAPDIAWQEDVFIAAGRGKEVFEPRFTYHGFRYAEISGYPSVPRSHDITGLVMHAGVPAAGTFSCPDTLINRIQAMCRNTFLSNLFSVQSDCPHREKFGYGGDILATCEALMNNFDMSGFYRKTITDFADAARPDGGLTETAPFVGIADAGLGNNGAGPIEWGSVVPELIYRLYQYYGDRSMVETAYPVVKKWVDFLTAHARDHLIDVTLGDHESIDPKDLGVSGTSFYYYNTRLLAWMAGLLGRNDEAARYSSLALKIKKRFNERFVDPATGVVGLGTQATQAHALYFGLLDEAVAAKALEVLEDRIVTRHRGHIATGMFGTKYVPEVLGRSGRDELALGMVRKAGFPGWAYMLANGATTVWEHWAFSDNTFSHNHPMFGVISEWFYRYLGGIRPADDAVGFDRILIRPQAGSLGAASTSYESVLGRVSCNWKVEHHKLYLEVRVPVNARACILIPSKEKGVVTEGGKPLSQLKEIELIAQHKNRIQVEVGSGLYRFCSELP